MPPTKKEKKKADSSAATEAPEASEAPAAASSAPAEASTSAATKAHTIQRATVNKVLIVRSTSETQSEKLGEIPVGTIVYILETPREFCEGGPLRAPVSAVDTSLDLPKGWVTLVKNGDDFAVLAEKDVVHVPEAPEPASPAKGDKGHRPALPGAKDVKGKGGKVSARKNAKAKAEATPRSAAKKKKSAPKKKGGGTGGTGGGGDLDVLDEGLEVDEIDVSSMFEPLGESNGELLSAEKLHARAEYYNVQVTRKEVHIQTLSDLEVRLGKTLNELSQEPGHKMKDLFALFDRNGDEKVTRTLRASL